MNRHLVRVRLSDGSVVVKSLLTDSHERIIAYGDCIISANSSTELYKHVELLASALTYKIFNVQELQELQERPCYLHPWIGESAPA